MPGCVLVPLDGSALAERALSYVGAGGGAYDSCACSRPGAPRGESQLARHTEQLDRHMARHWPVTRGNWTVTWRGLDRHMDVLRGRRPSEDHSPAAKTAKPV
jgi:hypothetical protein